MRRAAAAGAAAALGCLALALPGGARAAADMESMFQDDVQLVYGTPAQVANALDVMKSLGVDRIRVSVFWRLVAPDPDEAKRPPIRNGNIGPASPEWYPPEKWERYDTLVRLAAAKGIEVNFNLTSPVPNWAAGENAPRADVRDTYRPSAEEFGRFVHAVGFRYSGSYTPPAPPQPAPSGSSSGGGGSEGLPIPGIGSPPGIGSATTASAERDAARAAQATGPLPRVVFWTFWNEPNQGGWLSPQWAPVSDGGSPVATSPRLYRDLVDAAFAGLFATGHAGGQDTILIGELAPKGSNATTETSAMKPGIFLRALYCVDRNLAPLRGGSAAVLGCPEDNPGGPAFAQAHPGLFNVAGIAHHPYNFPLAPNRKSRDRDFAALADMPRFESWVDRIFALYGQARRGGVPIWFTEYGYQTKPPDPLGITLSRQAEYLDHSEYLAAKNRRVRSSSQFLLVDDKPLSQFPRDSAQYWGTFQTGLIQLDGTRKPAFDSYKLPVWLPGRVRPGRTATVWGLVRAAPNGAALRAIVETGSRPGGPWRRRKTVRITGPRGQFRTKIRLPRRGYLRIRSRVGSDSLVSRTVRIRATR